MADGTILGFKTSAFDDVGAYLRYEPLGGVIWSQVLPGCYRFKHLKVDYTGRCTNKMPGRAEPRLLAAAAPLAGRADRRHRRQPARLRPGRAAQEELHPRRGVSPTRRRTAASTTRATATATLDRALELVDYEGWRARQREADRQRQADRDRDRLDPRLRHQQLRPGPDHQHRPALLGQRRGGDRQARPLRRGQRRLGTCRRARATRRPTAQVVADMLGCRPRRRSGSSAGADSARNAYVAFSGTYASQFAVTGIGAALGAAAGCVREILLAVAAVVLEATARSCVLNGGTASVEGDEDRALTFAAIANLVYANIAALPPELADRVTPQPPLRLPAAVRGPRLADQDRPPDPHLRQPDPRLRGGDRGGDRQSRDPRLRDRRRVRDADQPADRRGPGARRGRPRDRRGAAGDARVRRATASS